MNLSKKINCRKTALTAFSIVVLAPGIIFGQQPNLFEEYSFERLEFEVTYFLVPERSQNETDLSVFAQIPYSSLIFFWDGKEFHAEYEITVYIRDKKGDLVQSKGLKGEIRTKKYVDTESADLFEITTSRLSVAPGDYSLTVALEDINSKTQSELSEDFRIKTVKDNEILTTNVIVINNLEQQNDKILSFRPVASKNLKNSESKYYTYFEIIPRKPGERYLIEVELRSISRRKSKTISEREFLRTSDDGNIRIAVDFMEDNLPSGSYEMKYKISADSFKDKKFSKDVYLSWFGEPTNENDLDIALSQMKYAFDKVMYENLDAFSYEEKLELFNTVWSMYDPSLGTSRNEFKERYYERVRYANNEFSHFMEGWKTDRGMIHILFGPPNQILFNDFGSNTRSSQTWIYYSNAITFEFIDRYSTGNFQLRIPYNYDPYTRPIR